MRTVIGRVKFTGKYNSPPMEVVEIPVGCGCLVLTLPPLGWAPPWCSPPLPGYPSNKLVLSLETKFKVECIDPGGGITR